MTLTHVSKLKRITSWLQGHKFLDNETGFDECDLISFRYLKLHNEKRRLYFQAIRCNSTRKGQRTVFVQIFVNITNLNRNYKIVRTLSVSPQSFHYSGVYIQDGGGGEGVSVKIYTEDFLYVLLRVRQWTINVGRSFTNFLYVLTVERPKNRIIQGTNFYC